MINQSVERWFAPGFLEREPQVASQLLESLRAAEAEAYGLACEALADFDVRSRLGEIAVPVLAVAGAEDFAIPPERSPRSRTVSSAANCRFSTALHTWRRLRCLKRWPS